MELSAWVHQILKLSSGGFFSFEGTYHQLLGLK